jgi:hypothetical protein
LALEVHAEVKAEVHSIGNSIGSTSTTAGAGMDSSSHASSGSSGSMTINAHPSPGIPEDSTQSLPLCIWTIEFVTDVERRKKNINIYSNASKKSKR